MNKKTDSQQNRQGTGQKRKRRAVSWFLNILIAVLIISGVFFLARPRVINYLSDQKTEEVLSLVEYFEVPAVTEVIGRDEYQVAGEELEQLVFEEELQPGETEADETSEADEDDAIRPAEIVNLYATLQIPKIDLTIPVANEATLYAIRLAVGHWSPGQRFGEQGNAVIFGHYMQDYGRHFNRLNEVIQGDQLIVTTYDAVYVYQVDRQLIIYPQDLLPSITAPTTDARLILVTCTPTAEQRLLIYSHLVEVIPVTR